MLTKRFFLIAGGTVGGLGAVLSITPPQFGSTSGLSLSTGSSLGGGSSTSLASGSSGTSTSTTSQPATTPTPAAAKKATTTKKTTTKKTTTKKSTSSSSSASSSGSTTTSTPAAKAGVSGTFTGDLGNTVYGPVQVQITVVNNKITNATALTYPTGSFRDQQINQQAIPYLIQETLAAQSANIQGVGGASYTSQGWVVSLQSALSKAGL
jgi:uncharacterized protein with FMN-binding domain